MQCRPKSPIWMTHPAAVSILPNSSFRRRYSETTMAPSASPGRLRMPPRRESVLRRTWPTGRKNRTGGPDRASGSGVTMPASAAGSADNDARDGKSASLSESRLAARRDVDNDVGARAADPADPAPVAGNAADHRYVGPDLRIPIIDEDDIPPVRAAYEYEAAEPTDAESDAAVRAGEEATGEETALSPVVAQPAIRAAESLKRLREPDVEPPTLAETVNRAALRVAQGGPGRYRSEPGRRRPFGRAGACP